eukprot:CAMPEP_0185849564 /NCGR_PEP_ID=MMETSP1354-20130828/4035_1 /TAXON_ID=708628 /ORGANISM="Erythrolobus madagascarensis, Strain CCMP3276" /LENGTH=267 /DNA_ID=CAMNT_0028550119 /DNA_START=57 /DNA_END=860 /DNA_ORIENTATION=+
MTSLDMAGFSLTLLDTSAHPELPSLLQESTNAVAWAKPVPYSAELEVVPCPADVDDAAHFTAPEVVSADGAKLRDAIRAAAEAVVAAEPDLTAADLIVGDGDCGLTLKQGAERVLEDLDSYPVNDAANTLVALGTSVASSMGGTSGVLYSLGFNAAATALSARVASGGTSSTEHWLAALKAGGDAISFYGGAKAGMRTMLDALFPAAEAQTAADAAEAAVKGAKSTADMGKAGAGRSSYIKGEDLMGTADPGATAVGVWLSAIAAAL